MIGIYIFLGFIAIVLLLYLLTFLPIDICYSISVLLALLAAFVLLWKKHSPSKNLTAVTEGTVSRIHSLDKGYHGLWNMSKSSKSYDAYDPEFTYIANGAEYVKRSEITEYGGKRFYEGQRVTILYDPYDPNQYFVMERRMTSIPNKIAKIIFAVLCIGLSVLCLSVALQRSPLF